MKTARLVNGEQFNYDSCEERGNVTLFYRNPHGLYRAFETKDLITTDTANFIEGAANHEDRTNRH